jgi:CDP-diglyceride synthetase
MAAPKKGWEMLFWGAAIAIFIFAGAVMIFMNRSRPHPAAISNFWVAGMLVPARGQRIRPGHRATGPTALKAAWFLMLFGRAFFKMNFSRCEWSDSCCNPRDSAQTGVSPVSINPQP